MKNYECSFFIFPNVGLIISELGKRPSHPEMLGNMGFSESDVKNIMNNIPRGYYKDGKIAIYQEYEIDKPGYILEIKPEHENVVKEYLKDLAKLLNLDSDTDVYFGMRVGKIGEVWELIRHHKLSEFI